MKHIKIFDTTLRDGEQAPGCNMNAPEKLEVAKQLETMRVDVIEAGFPVVSRGDFESVALIASEIKNAEVCSLARAMRGDIDIAWESLRRAAAPRIHVFIATSPVHMKYKLKMTSDEVLARVSESVAYAKSLCPNIEFSAEDAGRSELDFLCKVFDAAIAAGASVINVPDTVGYLNPLEVMSRIEYIREHVTNIDSVEISVHHHNDLGLATANSLAAVLSGASQIECSVNGLGERAGNAALEEIVMGINTRKSFYNAFCNVDTTKIYRISKLVSGITGVKIPPNKAIIGRNAFMHEAGIHQHGVMEEPSTYEIMTPDSIGVPRFDSMVLGKHSGKHALGERLAALGYAPSEAELEEIFEKFKAIADKKKSVSDRDLEAIMRKLFDESASGYKLVSFIINSGNQIDATAAIKLELDGKKLDGVSLGAGPIDAGFTAIDTIIGIEAALEDYSLNSITEGEDALGEAVVKLRYNGKIITGRGVSTDVIEASLKAYLNGINRICAMMEIKDGK